MALPLIRLKPLTWHPHLAPVEVSEATPLQLAAMSVTPSAKKVSPYVRTLAHDPESHVARTQLFNAIMYAEGGLPRVDRELGALATSTVNGCRYCAVVHARQHARLSKCDHVVSAIIAGALDELGPRDRAIFDFSVALSHTPSRAAKEHVEKLREVGLAENEILDLIHAVAIFGWANRLMHPLGRGEPTEDAAAAHSA